MGGVRGNGGSGKIRYSVLFVGDKYTMPMNGSGLVHTVMYSDDGSVSFGKVKGRSRNLPVNGQSFSGFSRVVDEGVIYIKIVGHGALGI